MIACRLCGSKMSNRLGEFCCAGCARVFDVLSSLEPDAGEAYLRAARALGLVPSNDNSEAGGTGTANLTNPSVQRRERYRVEGLSCPSCAWIVETVLRAQPGIVAAQCDFFTGTASITYDLRRTSTSVFAAPLTGLGYHLASLADGEKHSQASDRMFEFLVCGIMTMNLMTLSVVRYAADLKWIGTPPRFLAFIELALCLPVMWIGWLPLARRAWASLRQRRLTMESLLSLSSGMAFLLSLVALLAGRTDIYFDTAAGLITIFSLSRMIETRLRERALRETLQLMRLETVNIRTVDEDGREKYAPLDMLVAGDRAIFHPGETVPVDGELLSTFAYLTESMITGESRPLRKERGDLLLAGSTVSEGRVELRICHSYRETAVYQITRALQELLQRDEGRLRIADRVATIFTSLVLIVAAGAWFARLGLHGWLYALSASGWIPSVAVLAVACPCAFSLAGTTALMAAVSRLLSRGVLVKDLHQLERLSEIRTVIFDKTGTLTEGQITVAHISWEREEREELLPLVLAAEQTAAHPVGRAIAKYLQQRGLHAAKMIDAEDLLGRGRRLEANGGEFLVGAASLFDHPFRPLGVTSRQTLSWFGWGRHAEGCFLLEDKPRYDAAETIDKLRAAGLRAELLSGDCGGVCNWMAQELGLDNARGEATLEDKVEIVQQRAAAGERIAYVGDGTNDALAMREACASLAVPSSADQALYAAGLVMLRPDLRLLPEIFALGKRLSRVLRWNYGWALLFNGAFVPLAALGELRPLMAMLLMLFSSSAVLLNSLRLRRA